MGLSVNSIIRMSKNPTNCLEKETIFFSSSFKKTSPSPFLPHLLWLSYHRMKELTTSKRLFLERRSMNRICSPEILYGNSATLHLQNKFRMRPQHNSRQAIIVKNHSFKSINTITRKLPLKLTGYL